MTAHTRPKGVTAVVLAALTLVGAVACVRNTGSPLGPPVATGDPITGVNPEPTPTPGARSKTVRYGPYDIPAATGTGHEQSGMIKDQIALGVERPCSDCFITGIHATLKRPNGEVVNADKGLWLHHIVLATMGRVDPTCGSGTPQLLGERFFASGNERTRARFPSGTGLPVGPIDTWSMVYDLMNTNMQGERVVIDIAYDWVPASTPNMRAIKPVWLDVSPVCGGPGLRAWTGKYRYAGNWTVNVPGRVIGVGGHLHDGGTNLVVRNDSTGSILCDSRAGYGGPGFVPPASDGHAGHGAAHLSSMTQCLSRSVDRPMAVLARGQQVSIEANYDADLHPHGTHPVMGIALLYVLP